jgi:hypothetical protein
MFFDEVVPEIENVLWRGEREKVQGVSMGVENTTACKPSFEEYVLDEGE